MGKRLEKVRLHHPFLLKTVDPPLSALEGKPIRELRRIGKRIALGFDEDLWLIIHLMLAGRLQWKPPGFKLSGKYYLAAFDFPDGSLIFTEAGSKRRASLHILRGADALHDQDPGGIEVLSSSLQEFTQLLRSQKTHVKNLLTDPKRISGIGNAYSDEILHRARLSPFAIANRLKEDQIKSLYYAIHSILTETTEILRQETGAGFPAKVTAFRSEMAVHGKFGRPCPVCAAPIQRIRYADKKETNYCPGCQTQGRILADRVLSRLLKNDRPKHLNDLKNPL
jgi:formamidopyrimidine-DNA glycosylase